MVSEQFMPVVAAALAFGLAFGAEVLHGRRVRHVVRLAFGGHERPAGWVRGVPWLRAAAAAALAWGLVTLTSVEPKSHSANGSRIVSESDYRHVLLVLDVSPSMRLMDAGPQGTQSRMQRGRAVMESFFRRVPLEQYRISVVATYNGAKPVVVDTHDVDVVRNVLGDLPMHFAFPAGKTRLFDGLEEAARIAHPWNPGSTTVLVLSDGDTVPTKGMPSMPASVRDVVVIGVGDAQRGTFIDGRQSRQDVSTLRQIATRLGGTFHNGNEKHLASTLIGDLTRSAGENVLERLSRREYALICCALGAALLALIPLALHYLGTAWRPGVLGAQVSAMRPRAPDVASAGGRDRTSPPSRSVGFPSGSRT